MSTIVILTEATFDAKVVKVPGPVLVSFLAEWSGPCKMIEPGLKEIAAEFSGRLTAGNLDIDQNPAIPPKYNVTAIPTHLLFKGGKVVGTKIGPWSKAQLVEWLKESNI
ncbi:thioredoxin domain-containing protein [Streptomyces sp. NPDC048659]|uniref:thioredoxin family protein n=1 Tax=Streptomyces sp. NPDC048659 TaxID=3155489 RepID=UPI003419DCB1